ncbi:unnamed protein product [Heligmosomoides polygyrus]|uniref:VASt domain-containing protein n=1 Tax=Heligmosomoides polygyrus TaxID=6339 RepID=A0A183FTL3_HELPZ|nr:unnamed protein product [Heligmosomoides polygyrus]
MFEPQHPVGNLSAYNDLMTSSAIEPMTSMHKSMNGSAANVSSNNRLEDVLRSSIGSVDSWISSFENLMTSSFHGVMRDSVYSTTSDGNSTVTRDREDSNAATLVASLTDSEDEGTPLVLTPVPSEEQSKLSWYLSVRISHSAVFGTAGEITRNVRLLVLEKKAVQESVAA